MIAIRLSWYGLISVTCRRLRQLSSLWTREEVI
jgi:hypothetical protein